MATSFSIIIREVAKHANAFASGSAAVVQMDYTATTPAIAQVVDPYFNLDFIKDKIVDVYGRVCLEIANVESHPWRAFVGPSVTGNLTNGAAIPTVAANAKSIVGRLGQVLGDGVAMSPSSPERVGIALRNSFGAIFNDPLLYYYDGNKIYHTETNATINVCTYERVDTVTLIGATPPGSIGLPDVLVDVLVAGAVAQLIVEAKGMEQASYFKALFEAGIASIRQGQTVMPLMSVTPAAP